MFTDAPLDTPELVSTTHGLLPKNQLLYREDHVHRAGAVVHSREWLFGLGEIVRRDVWVEVTESPLHTQTSVGED